MPIYLGVCGCCDTCCQVGDLFCDSFDTDALGLSVGGLLKWNIVAGDIDVIGVNAAGKSYYDFLPGHGRYVDLSGTSRRGAYDGTIRTKDPVNVPAGNYILSLLLAGNNRAPCGTTSVRVTFGPVDATVGIADWLMPFTTYKWDISGPVNDHITIQQLPGPVDRYYVYGTPLDCVRVHAAPTT